MDKRAKISLGIAVFLGVILTASIVFAPPLPKECNDGADNDGDGAIDYPNDGGCQNKKDNDETNCGDGVCEGGETTASCPADCLVQCNDGLDNDGDGHVDIGTFGDSECVDSSDDDESPRDFCSDTDGGVVETVAGTVSGEDDGVSFSNDDFCVSSSVVGEYYCGGVSSDYDPSLIQVTCQVNATCSNGACVF